MYTSNSLLNYIKNSESISGQNLKALGHPGFLSFSGRTGSKDLLNMGQVILGQVVTWPSPKNMSHPQLYLVTIIISSSKHRTLKLTELATDFQRYRSVILDLESRYQKFRSNITLQIQRIIPKLRSGIENQIELTKILEFYRTSPWEKETFLTLLNTRKKEIGKHPCPSVLPDQLSKTNGSYHLIMSRNLWKLKYLVLRLRRC